MARRQPDRRVRRPARRRRPGPRARTARGAAGLEPPPGRGGLDRPGLARRVRRPRRLPGPAGHLPRGVRPRRRARPGLHRGRGTARPDPDRVRHARAAQTLPAPDQGRGRAVVPGLLRTRRRLRPGQRRHQGHPGRRTLGDHRSEDLDLAGPRGRLVLRAGPDRARLDPQQRPVLPAGPDAPARGHGPPDPPAHRHLGVQRGVLRRRPHRRGPRRRPARRRLERGQGHPGLRTRRGHARPAGRLPPRPGQPAGSSPPHRRGRRSPAQRQAGPGLDRPGSRPRLRPRHPGRRRPHAGLGAEDPVVPLAPAPRRAGHGNPRPVVDGGPERPGRLAAPVPVHPGRDDLRRVGRDPAQHHRHPRPRPAPNQQNP